MIYVEDDEDFSPDEINRLVGDFLYDRIGPVVKREAMRTPEWVERQRQATADLVDYIRCALMEERIEEFRDRVLALSILSGLMVVPWPVIQDKDRINQLATLLGVVRSLVPFAAEKVRWPDLEEYRPRPRKPPRRVHIGPPLININTASAEELMKIPGIGDSIAADIIKFRPYHDITQLEWVRGINGKRLKEIRAHLTLK